MGERNVITVTDPSKPEVVVGQATLGPNKKGTGLWLQNLSVDDNHRRQGYGEELLTKALQLAPEGLSLEVRSDNVAAVNLYQKNGFEVYEIITDRNGNEYYRMSKKN